MRFKHLINVRCQISDNCSGKQHSTCFSTNHTCSDHMISNIKIILWRKVLFHHKTHLFISGHHNITHGITGIICIHMIVI